MRALLVVLSLVPAVARADQSADRDLLLEYKRLAIEASRTGNCDPARELATQVKSLDPAFFANEYASDPAIASCLPPPSSPAAIAPIDNGAPLTPPSEQPPIETPRVPFYLPERPAVPPLDGGRLIGEILLGSVIGFGGVLIGGFAGAGLCSDNGGDDFACLGSIVAGAYVVGAVGVGIGIGIAGRTGGQTGSIGAAIGGTMLGALISLLSLATDSEQLIAVSLIGGPLAGGLIGFNLTRRWRDPSPAPIGSLLRVSGGGVSLGIPLVTHGEVRGVATTSVPLVSGSF